MSISTHNRTGENIGYFILYVFSGEIILNNIFVECNGYTEMRIDL
jgi:hypothetical protein